MEREIHFQDALSSHRNVCCPDKAELFRVRGLTDVVVLLVAGGRQPLLHAALDGADAGGASADDRHAPDAFHLQPREAKRRRSGQSRPGVSGAT